MLGWHRQGFRDNDEHVRAAAYYCPSQLAAGAGWGDSVDTSNASTINSLLDLSLARTSKLLYIT